MLRTVTGTGLVRTVYSSFRTVFPGPNGVLQSAALLDEKFGHSLPFHVHIGQRLNIGNNERHLCDLDGRNENGDLYGRN